MSKHTPGPWYYRPEEPSVEAQNEESFNMTVADCSRSYVIEDEQAKANAQLISQAPLMFQALTEIAERGPVDSYNSASALRLRLVAVQSIARAALANLSGEDWK